MYKLVVLISGNGSNLQAIIDAITAGEIKAEVSAVISNRSDAYGLMRAKKAGIPTRTLDHTTFKGRAEFDQALQELIDSFQPDLVVLAGFMRILSDEFVTHYRNRLINIHPSLLPRYRGLNTHQRALQNGDTQHGASVHFVIPELDAGTVLVQGVVPVKTNDDESTLAQRVHQIEHQIYPRVIQWLAEQRLRINAAGEPELDGIPLREPVKMTFQER